VQPLDSFFMCTDGPIVIGKVSDIVTFSVCSNGDEVSSSFFPPKYALMPCFVGDRLAPVPAVLCTVSQAEIGAAVIECVAIDVIDIYALWGIHKQSVQTL